MIQMTTTFETGHRFVFLGSQKGLFTQPLPTNVFVCHDRSEVEAAVISPSERVTWVSFTRNFTDILLSEGSRFPRRSSRLHLITLTPPRSESIAALLSIFHLVFGVVEGVQWLSKDELVEVITRDDAADRFIGGSTTPRRKL